MHVLSRIIDIDQKGFARVYLGFEYYKQDIERRRYSELEYCIIQYNFAILILIDVPIEAVLNKKTFVS